MLSALEEAYTGSGLGGGLATTLSGWRSRISAFTATGEVGGGYGTETYTSVQNLNASSVKVRATYVTLTGEGNVQFDATIPGQTRMTFNMADKVPAGDYGVIVESLTAGKPIMVERSMYFLGRACGTNTIGGYGD